MQCEKIAKNTQAAATLLQPQNLQVSCATVRVCAREKDGHFEDTL